MASRRMRIGDMARLGARLLQELEPRRRGKEEVAHLDPRAGADAPPACGSPLAPPSISRLQAVSAPAGREVMAKRLTEAIEGSASPRKPSVRMSLRSSSGSLEVQWRSTASASSSARHADAVVDHRDEACGRPPSG